MSFRSYLYCLLTGLVVSIALGLGLIFTLFGEQPINRLTGQLQQQVMLQVQQQLREYLRSAERINAINQALLEQGLIELGDDSAWIKHFNTQVQQFNNISYITVSQPSGAWVGLNNTEGERLFVRVDEQQHVYHHPWNAEGLLQSVKPLLLPYNTLQREWFTGPVAARRSQWSDIYSWLQPPQLAMSLGKPLFDEKQQLRALFSVDLSLHEISRFLRRFQLGKTGGVYIIDRKQMMVASSTPYTPYIQQNEKLQRVAAVDYRDPLLSAVAKYLLHKTPENELFNSEQQLSVDVDGEQVAVQTQPLYTSQGLQWLVVTAVPRGQLMGGLYMGVGWALLAVLLLLLAALLLAGWLANRWTRPLTQLAEKVDEVRWLNLNQRFDVDAEVLEVRQLSDALEHMQAGLQSFAKYVPRDLVRQILQKGEVAELGGEQRLVTVMFADIERYSSVAEHLAPEQVILMLNQYFQAMQKVIALYGGTMIEQLGDGVLAVFGAPHILQDNSVNAVRCAMEMQDVLVQLNKQWQVDGLADSWRASGESDLSMRIGLHRGHVVAGNIGGEEYMKYGVIGDVVNVASRLENMNKLWSTHLSMSSQVYNLLDEDLAARFESRGAQQLKGRHKSQIVYTLKK